MIITAEPESCTLRLVFDTDVIKAAGGREQRAAIEPMATLEIEAEYLVTALELRELRRRLFREYLDTHEMVLWPFETFVVGSTDVDNVVVDVLSAAPLAAQGRRLVLRAGVSEHAATVSAAAVVGGDYELTMAPSPDADHRATGTRVLPLVNIRLRDNATTGRWRLNEIGRWNLQAVVTSFFQTLGLGATAILEYDDFYLLDVPSSIEDKELLTEQHQAGLQGPDGPGPVEVVSQYEFGDIARQAKFSWHTEADRQFWFNFFATIEGRRLPFLYPTWRPDLTPLVTPADTDTTITIATGAYEDWWEAKSHKRLAVMWSDGTFQPVKVTALVDNLDDTTTLELDEAIEVPADTEFAYLSFLEVVRLADDVIEIQYAAGQGSFDLPMVTVQDDA